MVIKLRRKDSISKIKVTSDIFLIRGIFRTLKHSNVGWCLHPCQAYCKVFGKKVLCYNYFCRTLLLRPFLDVWQDSKCARVSINASYLVQLFQVLLQAYSDIFEHYQRAYSSIFRTLSIAGIFRTLTYSYHKAYADSKVYS